nr:PREDICTED: FAD synthase-like isoform X1 [Bemisia tabaci]
MEIATAGILIIGDEILNGEVVESNAFYMCCNLRQLGVKVARITVIGDDVEEIASHVMDFSKKFNYVITTGGIGPTHDDVTYQGVAKAFKVPLVCNENLLKYWDKIYSKTGWNLDKSAWKRMATIPGNAKVTFFQSNKNSEGDYTVIVSNIFILPGVPSIVKRVFLPLAKECITSNNVFYSTIIYLNRSEEQVMPYLNPVVEKYDKKVAFGSYPIFSNRIYHAKITVESPVRETFQGAVSDLKSSIPQEWQVNNLEVAAENLQKAINSFLFISQSVEILDECFKRYQLSNIAVAFNGGKDCTALLHLVYAYCRFRSIDVSSKKLQCIYFRSNDVFQELENFVEETVKRYDINLLTIDGEIKTGLDQALKENPQWEAILMGTRQSDPFSSCLQAFQMTDVTWPRVMRVNPMLHWSYEDVWFFLRYLNVPYCSLYDDGYTSLGHGSTTKKNPDLQYLENGVVKYYPAFKLKYGDSERNGRK